MNEIKIFEKKEFGAIRVQVVNDEPMFCLVDVCKPLGLRADGVLPRLRKDGYNQIVVIDSMGRNQEAYFINEKNLYRAIMRSDKEEALEFQDWVCDEVLPSIRKNGIYATDNVIDQILDNPDFGIELLTKLKDERAARMEAEKTVAILTHTNKTYTCTEVAKEIGLKSAQELNEKLFDMGVQYKVNGTWLPYTKYSELAWFDLKQEVMDNGHIIYHRRITGMGREAIIKLLNNK